ncbi:MAG: cell division protein ZapA [Clostridiales bacterium]|jgi:cell division protein ZapA (FtsZ GTPase activity inhibitor)|nr:cell division protein ZapA [Clostridiales bacterium]
MATNRIKLTICDTEYIITSDESESYVRELGEELDSSMRALMEGDSRVSTTMAAILTALNFADEARKASESADNLRVQIKEYLNDNARIRAELDEARREADRLRRELDEILR